MVWREEGRLKTPAYILQEIAKEHVINEWTNLEFLTLDFSCTAYIICTSALFYDHKIINVQ